MVNTFWKYLKNKVLIGGIHWKSYPKNNLLYERMFWVILVGQTYFYFTFAQGKIPNKIILIFSYSWLNPKIQKEKLYEKRRKNYISVCKNKNTKKKVCISYFLLFQIPAIVLFIFLLLQIGISKRVSFCFFLKYDIIKFFIF